MVGGYYYSKDRVRIESFNRGTDMRNFDYYFYCVHLDSVYPNNGGYSLVSSIFCFNSSDVVYEDSTVISFSLRYCFKFIISTSNFTSANSTSTFSPSFTYFSYDKQTGHCDYSSNYTYVEGSYLANKYYFYQETNLPNFPYCESVASPAANSLNVSVSFNPGLSGNVNREIVTNGSKSYLSQLNMTVVNNSRFAVQYKMWIVKKNQTTHRTYDASGTSSASELHKQIFDDDPVFMYYSSEWCYSTNIDNSADYYNGLPQKQNKSCEWHYLSSGGTANVIFNFSQINLVENEEYLCYVEAIRNDYGCSSRMFVSAAETVYPELKQLSNADRLYVYQSEFRMIHYSDVKYNPNDTENGVLPYNSYADGQNYAFSYNASEDANGAVDYTGKNVYKDKDSWWTKSYHPQSISIPSSYSSSGSSSLTNLASSLSGFFLFVNVILGWFPPNVITVFTLGILAIVVVAFFKVVFK